jgi:hypothetical protein
VRSIIILGLLAFFMLVGIKYIVDKSHIRNAVLEAIREGVAPEQLIVFNFTKSEVEALNWKKDHEFELAGEMYDIVETSIAGDTLIYTCFHDTKETKYKRRFYKFLGSLLIPNSDQQKQDSKFKIEFKLYFMADRNVQGAVMDDLSNNKSSFYYLVLYGLLLDGPISPPPQI